VLASLPESFAEPLKLIAVPAALPGGPYSGAAGTAISFSGSANDSGSDASTYQWDWNSDGAFDASGQTASHIWSAGGSYTFGLKVTDAQGGEGTATVAVTISAVHSLSLVSGWNLVSFNLHPADTSIAAVLSSIAGQYDLVYAWDATGGHTTGSGNWVKYDPAVPYGNSLSNLDESIGFWIHMTSARTLTVTGTAPATTGIALLDNVGGWNLVGYPSAVNSSLPGALSDHGVGTDFRLVYSYRAVDTGDPWKLYDRIGAPYANDLTEFVPGWGYWVSVSADHTWSVEYAAP
jgi:hypothetical protein